MINISRKKRNFNLYYSKYASKNKGQYDNQERHEIEVERIIKDLERSE